MTLEQRPYPGCHLVRYAGDTLKIELLTDGSLSGRGYVRTNLGSGALRGEAVTAAVEGRYVPSSRHWNDIPMADKGGGRFECVLPLVEIGYFEAKCVFIASGSQKSYWVSGENIRIKTEPADTSAANMIYNAFVRQFGNGMDGTGRNQACVDAENLLDRNEYTVIPPSGRFRTLQRELPFIMETMGFRIIQLLPIQPPPTTYARMGRYGSPFATTDYFGVDPSLADFDRYNTPMDQFQEFVHTVHGRGGLVFLDLPIDHTGWASTLQVHRPQWFCRNVDGGFASPGAWGVVWEDLCKLDFSKKDLWVFVADVFLHWAELGVDGFRCDAGYMVPQDAWEYIIQKVRLQYPDVIFFLEGLGGSLDVTDSLLASGGMNWAYSEIFQVYGAEAIRSYLKGIFEKTRRHGLAVNFAETHDNARLALGGRQWSVMRTSLAALSAPCGAFGIANGVEWLATEKIDVHGATSLNWGNPDNIVSHLQRLNAILRCHPAFGKDGQCRIAGDGTAVGIARVVDGQDCGVLVILNVEQHDSAWLQWTVEDFPMTSMTCDLLSGRLIDCQKPQHGFYRLTLQPGEAVCLSNRRLEEFCSSDAPDANDGQRLRQLILSAIVQTYGYRDVSGWNLDELCDVFRDEPRAFMGMLVPGASYVPVVEWRSGRDSRRRVPVPHGHAVLLRERRPFRVRLVQGGRVTSARISCRLSGGDYGTLLFPVSAGLSDGGYVPEEAVLEFSAFENDSCEKESGTLLLLPLPATPAVSLSVEGRELTSRHLGLASNSFGSYGLVRGRWGELASKYDAMLAAGLSVECPVDRMAALLRCRIWVQHHDYSMELSHQCQRSFTAGYGNRLEWRFEVPSSLGLSMTFTVTYTLERERNRGALLVRYANACDIRNSDGLSDDAPARLIIRPDVDWRSCHQVTKAYAGAERAFPEAVSPLDGTGFRFAPSGGKGLEMRASGGSFVMVPEWRYQVRLQEDAERGLPSETDIFSPGYFQMTLSSGSALRLDFAVCDESHPGGSSAETAAMSEAAPLSRTLPLGDCLKASLDAYIARRGDDKTVIAGFPWFLDWGRDTLICLRGLVAAGKLKESRDIIRAFAGFEENGTIPNMIRGKDSGDRATSDAPLWLFVAVEELLAAEGSDGLLSMDCGGRTLLEILESIAAHYHTAVPNGIRCDADSGLVFSPSHYTWMDTNYPAGTPREGYPVEIQALWLHALAFMARVSKRAPYGAWRERALDSFVKYFVRPDGQGLRDCLHGSAGTSASAAIGDDAVRPNQLLAVTLGGILSPSVASSVVSVCTGLAVPGGIRSLDDGAVEIGQPVVRDGVLLNDPHHPYWGHYEGDEDTRRKAAYHNGTAWGWQLPLLAEALYCVHGGDRRAVLAARSLLALDGWAMSQGCIGHIAEIYDGDSPHVGRGCPAQAWSMSEAYRVWSMLQGASGADGAASVSK